MTTRTSKPILFVDVDGVISLFGFPPSVNDFPGAFHTVDGIAHCISIDTGERMVRLAERFELVWATGWEERANEHLPWLLELPFRELPTLTFGEAAVFGSAHWKLSAIEEYAHGRPAAWIDDNLDEECEAWAAAREEPTLLVLTEPAVGMSDAHVEQLLRWADEVSEDAAA
ncbi:MAG TPA: HAD domain-containing protein [Thermoleophilaceae bacterium]|nr:HAD domain-containing protein [Thermoleophilaceae bacterium]